MKRLLLSCLVLVLFTPLVFGQACNEGERIQCGSSNVGVCQLGTQICTFGQWGVCLGAVGPTPEVCDDGLDNDCDGQVDENCECQEGETRPCGSSNVGICEYGTEACAQGAWSGACENEVRSKLTELCANNLDDDCDGEVDEGCTQQAQNQTSQPSQTCFNGVEDSDEEGVDCGGPCRGCVSCSDGVLNQGEVKVSVDVGGNNFSDCGGPHCPSCPTCFDEEQNQGETGVDCGGPCRSCSLQQKVEDPDEDGVESQIELRQGTNPNNPDTDGDGVKDGQDRMPLCPNAFCDANYGETPRTCPEDCEEEPALSLGWVLVVLLVLFLCIGGYLYYQFKKGATKVGKTFSGGKKEVQAKVTFDSSKYRTGQKEQRKTKVDKELEQSLKKAEKYFKQ